MGHLVRRLQDCISADVMLLDSSSHDLQCVLYLFLEAMVLNRKKVECSLQVREKSLIPVYWDLVHGRLQIGAGDGQRD